MPKRDEVAGMEKTAQRNGLLCLLDFLPNIIGVIRSRRVSWAVHVARMGRAEVHTGFWLRDLIERDHLEYIDVDWRIMLK